MPRSTEISHEIYTLSPAVANLGQDNVLQVPEDYFDNLAGEVIRRIKAMEAPSAREELQILSPVLYRADKTLPFSVEPLYFHMLAGEILGRIQESNTGSVSREIEEISPLLSRLEKKMPLSVPEGYFESLTPDLSIGKIGNRQAKVISIKSRRWVNYAAAAILIGFIGLGAWLIFSTNGNYKNPVANVNVEAELKASSDSEMLNYLEATPLASMDDIPVANLEELDTESILEDLPDNVLQQYLQDNPEIKESGTVN